jgi:MmyB-like transcription regulator ligand binding domain
VWRAVEVPGETVAVTLERDRLAPAGIGDKQQGEVVGHWWETHEVAQKRHGLKRYIHPTVGELTLHYEALVLPDDGDQLLTVYAAEPQTVDAERLVQLSELARATA